MRRNLWLAGAVGAVVGSWLTLVAVQIGEHGFALPGRGGGATTAESKPVATAPTDAARADAKAVEMAKQDDTASSKSQPKSLSTVQVASSTQEATNEKTTQPATASDSSPELPAIAAAASPASATDDTAKMPASDVAKDVDIAAAQKPVPANATPDKAAADPIPDNRIPADQIDREMSAAAHRTLPPQLQQQAQPKPESQQTSLDPASKPQGQTTTIELVRPFADQVGILTLGGRSVQLSGIIPTDVGRMCTGPSGDSWPCGQAARTAFRMYLRGRSIDCDVPDPAWKGMVKGECRYVRVDLSAWLVRFGWADPEPGSPLASLVDEARQKKRGIYGDDPRKNGKSTLAPPPAKEDPLNPI
ncbi:MULTISPECIES: thermonuclease family protein [unclassified Rhizobium]|uniref:thermonuclease family protein n=1 Tax=unclassified Rhizobium TaxID=2613769 RepID=UPI000EA9F89A|nr:MULTISPECIES: thermonuclease family protein [unclassified Rhizobium]AYG65136.1 hypothetical protein CCGE531_03400 [Rhizobium sp. CCGE531]AYG71620.1 hypothetical protein CCGE532_03390 [Rhizobium sp. CCGE532]